MAFEIGAKVVSMYGKGVVHRFRDEDAMYEVVLTSWQLAEGAPVHVYVLADQLTPDKPKSFAVGDAVQTVYGQGVVERFRDEDEIYEVLLRSWKLAEGAPVRVYVQISSLFAPDADVVSVEEVLQQNQADAGHTPEDEDQAHEGDEGDAQVETGEAEVEVDADAEEVEAEAAAEGDDEADAVAQAGAFEVGSAVSTQYGQGVVEKFRESDSMYEVLLTSWQLAEGAPVRVFVQAESLSEPSAAVSRRSSISEAVDAVTRRLSEVGDSAEVVVGGMVDALYDNAAAVAADLATVVEPLPDLLSQADKDADAVAESMADGLEGEQVSTAVDDTAALAVADVRGSLSHLTNALDAANNSADEVVESMGDQLIGNEARAKILQAASDTVGAAVADVKGAFDSLVSAVGRGAEAKFDVGSAVSTQYGQGVVEKFRESDSMYEVLLTSWQLAEGAPVRVFVQAESLQALDDEGDDSEDDEEDYAAAEAAALAIAAKKEPKEEESEEEEVLAIGVGGGNVDKDALGAALFAAEAARTKPPTAAKAEPGEGKEDEAAVPTRARRATGFGSVLGADKSAPKGCGSCNKDFGLLNWRYYCENGDCGTPLCHDCLWAFPILPQDQEPRPENIRGMCKECFKQESTVDFARKHDVHGAEDGTPLLLVHGRGQSRLTMAHHAEKLADAGFRVLSLDLPGHGACMDEPISLDACRSHMTTVLEAELRPGQKAVFVGVDFGAYLGMDVMASHPQLFCAAVFADAAHNYGPGATFRTQMTLRGRSGATGSKMMMQNAAKDAQRSKHIDTTLVSNGLLRTGVFLGQSSKINAVLRSLAPKQLLPKIESPVLFIAGELAQNDSVNAWQSLCEHKGQSGATIYSGVDGRFTHDTRFLARFVEDIATFYTSTQRASRASAPQELPQDVPQVSREAVEVPQAVSPDVQEVSHAVTEAGQESTNQDSQDGSEAESQEIDG